MYGNKTLKNSLVMVTILLGYSTTLLFYLSAYLDFPNRPLGFDAIPHAVKIRLLNYWGLAAFKWIPTYYFGNPHFIFYPFSGYILPSIFSAFFNLKPEQIIIFLNWFAYASILLLFFGIVFLIYSLGKRNVLPMLVAAIFFATSPAVLEPYIRGGTYMELFLSFTIPWGLLFLEYWLRGYGKRYLIVYMLLGIFAIYGHQVIGIVFVLGSLLWMLTDKVAVKERLKKSAAIGLLFLCISFGYTLPSIYFNLHTKIKMVYTEIIPLSFSVGDYFPVFFMIDLGFQKTHASLLGTNLVIFFGILFLLYINC